MTARVDTYLKTEAPPTRDLLATYIEGKDSVQAPILAGLFAEDAVMTIDRLPGGPDLPDRLEPASSIVHWMTSDFASRFGDIRTYGLEPLPAVDGRFLRGMKWLVLMHDHGAGLARVLTGTYDWTFRWDGPGAWRVAAAHIRITAAESLDDENGDLTRALQAGLPYPWCPVDAARRRISGQPELRALLQSAAVGDVSAGAAP